MSLENQGYNKDLAYIHDVGYDFHTREAAPGLLEMLRRRGVTEGLVVELGCGSGLLIRELIEAGYQAIGIDQSEAMIAMAQERNPRATFVKQSFMAAELTPCDAVISIGECLAYMFDPNNTPASLQTLFVRVHQALRPGGVFIFDMPEPGRGAASTMGLRGRRGEDWICVYETTEDPETKILTREITTFRKDGEHYRRDDERHRLRLYHGAELKWMLQPVGFDVELVRNFGEMELVPGLVGVVAQKKQFIEQ
ncbi:MAG: methyltransferase domain-containing protein [Gemmataceae bacterium]